MGSFSAAAAVSRWRLRVPVVGVVEALALEVDGGRVQDALYRDAVSGSTFSDSSLKDCCISKVVPSGRRYS